MNNMNSVKIFFWLAFVFSAVLFFLPISTSGQDGFGLDKVVHAVIFFLLFLFGRKAFPGKTWLVLFALIFYAFAVEYIQGNYLPLRHFDWYDITADGIGLAAGLLIKKNE